MVTRTTHDAMSHTNGSRARFLNWLQWMPHTAAVLRPFIRLVVERQSLDEVGFVCPIHTPSHLDYPLCSLAHKYSHIMVLGY